MQIDKIIKREVISLVISLILILLMFIGVSYSSFLTVDESEESNVITMGDLDFKFCTDTTCDSSISNYGQKIGFETVDGVSTPASIYPYETTSEALQTEPYIFNIKNTGTLDMYIKIMLKDDDSFTPSSSYEEYTKLSEVYANNLQVGISKCDNGVINRDNVIISSYGSLTDNEILSNQLLLQGTSNTYCLWTWLDNKTPNDVQKTYFVADISASGEYLPSNYRTKLCTDNEASTCMKTNYSLYAMNAIVKESTGNQNYNTIEYRYQGIAPHNYVKFNNELWRIIGVFEVETPTSSGYTKEYRMKIIRNDMLDAVVWNNNASSINDYTTSSIMKLLNKGSYYNRAKGTSSSACSTLSAVTSCDYTSTGLTSEAKSLIEPAKWYLSNVTLGKDIKATYSEERGTTVSHGVKATWNGTVGLMSPSDYMYASVTSYTSGEKNNTVAWKNNNYLHETLKAQWLLSSATSANNILFVDLTGKLAEAAGNLVPKTIRPVVYLKSNVKLTGAGDGTDTNPFELKAGD